MNKHIFKNFSQSGSGSQTILVFTLSEKIGFFSLGKSKSKTSYGKFPLVKKSCLVRKNVFYMLAKFGLKQLVKAMDICKNWSPPVQTNAALTCMQAADKEDEHSR